MKRLGFILLAMALSIGFIVAQKGEGKGNSKEPKAEFKKTTHDFGKIKESSEASTCEFVVKNTGKAPLIIKNVITSCGCTTPDYTESPILPGKEGSVKVAYSSIGRIGAFSKSVSIYTNVSDTIYKLTIKGEVLRK